jgi:hypothetical protein
MVFSSNDFCYFLLFDRIYRILGIFFLSPFPDERVKTNPLEAEEGFVRSMMCLYRFHTLYNGTGVL